MGIPVSKVLGGRNRRGTRLAGVAIALALPLGLGACQEHYRETLQRVSGTEGANSLGTPILVRNALVQTPPESGGPIYVTGSDAPLHVHLVNNTPQRDALIGVTTSAAAGVILSSGETGSASLNVELPVAQDVAFVEDDLTLVMNDLTGPLGPGSVVTLTFEFEKAPAVRLRVPVAIPDERGEREPEPVHGGHGHGAEEAAHSDEEGSDSH